ncbi:hypothetical protein SPM85_24765, partial [Enterobacter hormaechei subsp. xiangfangensis]
MNLIRRVSAIYKEQELPEYRGNPLIEALPEALTEDEVLLEMSYFPEIDEKIRWTAPANVREQYVERIKKFRCPQTNLIQAYKMILRALRESYALMNPLMILVKIIKLRWIHILSYDQMVSRKI